MKEKVFKKCTALVLVCLTVFTWGSLAKLAYAQETLVPEETMVDSGSKEILMENAPIPLNITHGSEYIETTHPSIVVFDDKPWNGYRYWMGLSPYPQGDDSKENPCIYASNDLENWEEPVGLENPISPMPENYERGVVYNSDPDLFYNSDTDSLECWWRFVDDNSGLMIIYRKISSDGINWSQEEIVSLTGRKTVDHLSFSVLYEDHMYKMWSIGSGYKVQYTQSKDAKNWDKLRTMEVPFRNSEMKPWHLDVIHTDIGYEMIFVAFDRKNDPHRYHMNLYYANIVDNQSVSDPVLILKPSSKESWDSDGLYKSTFFKDKSGTYHIIYSGISGSDHGIGYIKWSQPIYTDFSVNETSSN